MNIMVKMGKDKEKIKEFFNALTNHTNVKWKGDKFSPKGYPPNDEDQFDIDIALDLLNAYYFIIEEDILSWDTEDVLHYVPTDKFDIYDDIDEAMEDIEKDKENDNGVSVNNKISIGNVVIKAIDDKYGNVLIDFLREFTNVTWCNGDKFKKADDRYKDELGFDILREREGFKNLIFIIEDNRMTWETDMSEYKLKNECESYKWYDSVAEFLKSFSK